MNFVGHVQLALAAGAEVRGDNGADALEEAGFLLGAALPDIASMGRFRLDGPPAVPTVAAGVQLHHRSDDLFHRHRWFRTHSRAVAVRLEGAGLTRGAARACGHVGVELLLDGLLLDRHAQLGPSVRHALGRLTDRALGLDELVATGDRSAWRAHRARVAAWDLPDDYRQPAAVARRLQRIVAHRPRLAFEPERIATVATVLADAQQDVEAGAPAMIDELSDALAATTAPADLT